MDKNKTVTLGNNVVVAPGATVVSATVGDGATIGMGAHVLPGAVIGKFAYIDANAVVEAGTVVPEGELWTGVPARKLRVLSADDKAYMESSAAAASKLSQAHYEQSIKSTAEVEADIAVKEYREEHYMDASEPIPVQEPDVKQYYDLSGSPKDQGLFRTTNMNDEACLQAIQDEQLAADLEEEELLSHQASQERAWAALKELIDVRPDRAFQRDAVLKALDDSDPKAAKFVTGLIARASDGDATVVDDLNTMTVRGEASFVAPALAALKAHGDAQKLSK